jgi:hypothetical protein
VEERERGDLDPRDDRGDAAGRSMLERDEAGGEENGDEA